MNQDPIVHRLFAVKSTIAATGNTESLSDARRTAGTGVPRRSSTSVARTTADGAMSHASYRVMHVAASARPGAHGHPWAPRSIQVAMSVSETRPVARSKGSVIGVLWI